MIGPSGVFDQSYWPINCQVRRYGRASQAPAEYPVQPEKPLTFHAWSGPINPSNTGNSVPNNSCLAT